MNEQQRQFILSLLAYTVQRDIDAKQLCRLCDLDLEKLKKGPVDLSPKQFNDLWLNASHLCQDPLIGLHFGESLQLAALGAVGEIIKASATVGQAISIAASLTPTVTDLFTMGVTRSKKIFRVHLQMASPSGHAFVLRQLADMLLVFSIHELNGFLLGKIAPTQVIYPHALEHREEYERVFRCNNIRKGDAYAVEFDNRYWDEPILTANYELQKFFMDTLRSSQQDQLAHTQHFKAKVLNYLMQNSYLGILSLEDVAANFSITPRSLQRKLQDEGTTFQQLADSVKKSLALRFLESGDYPIKEISSILGYNEISAFSRAFKRWTGNHRGSTECVSD